MSRENTMDRLRHLTTIRGEITSSRNQFLAAPTVVCGPNLEAAAR